MNNEIAKIPEANTRNCMVCKQTYHVKAAIDKMLAAGEAPLTIFAIISDWDTGSFKNGKVPSDQSIRNHGKKHLPFRQNAYRKILEQRAAEQGIIIEEGTDSYITNIGMAEVIARKGFEDIVAGKAEPTVKETLEAIKLSEQFARESVNSFDAVQAMAQIQRIMAAIQKVVPQQYIDAIYKELENEQAVIVVDEDDSWFDEED